MKTVLKPRDKTNGLTYYVDSNIAWIPMYMQGRMVWLSRFWTTWAEDDSGKVDALSLTYYPSDPRA